MRKIDKELKKEFNIHECDVFLNINYDVNYIELGCRVDMNLIARKTMMKGIV